jgi:hypothetical protein
MKNIYQHCRAASAHFGFQKMTILMQSFIGILFLSGTWINGTAADETLPAGAFIIDMGITPQTFDNGLKPYGMVYDLVENFGVPVRWVINPVKVKDGTDFTYNGYEYKGGPFIVPAEYRSATVEARITFWMGEGVQGVTTTSAITVPVFITLREMPVWTLDQQNGKIAKEYLDNAMIPPSAYGGTNESLWPTPADLTCCHDLFMMPHADPEWDTHANLYDWNLNCDGAIWLACHAGSALENMFDDITPDANVQTNFLSQKTGPALGSGPWSDPGNALVLWGDHDAGTLPYSYAYPADPFM